MDLIFPRRCLLCRGWAKQVADEALFCQECAESIQSHRSVATCPTCAASVARYEVSKDRCGKCRDKRLWVAATARVGPYPAHLGHLIRAYKYHGREELDTVLAGWLTEAVEAAPWRDSVEAVVSVPTHWKRRLGRPLYAAERLASLVAGNTGLPHLPILRRTRAGPHQLGLGYTARQNNVRGAFALRPGVKLQDARLLLIDDVKTTGATVEECAKVLLRGGAAKVYAAVVVKVAWTHPTGQPITTI